MNDERALGNKLGRDVAEEFGVNSASPYIRAGLINPRRTHRLTIFTPADVALLQRRRHERVSRARTGDGDRRAAFWTNLDYVMKQCRASGQLARYAADHGLTEKQAETILRDEHTPRRHILRGAPPKYELREQLLAIASKVIDEHSEHGDLAQLSLTGFRAEIGLVAWQQDLETFRERYPASRDDPDAPALQWRETIAARVRGLVGPDSKALLDARK